MTAHSGKKLSGGCAAPDVPESAELPTHTPWLLRELIIHASGTLSRNP